MTGEPLPVRFRRIGQGTDRGRRLAARLQLGQRSDRFTGSKRFTDSDRFTGSVRFTGSKRRRAGSEKASGLLSTLTTRP